MKLIPFVRYLLCGAALLFATNAVGATVDPLLVPEERVKRPAELEELLAQGANLPVVVRIRIPNEALVLQAVGNSATRNAAKALIRQRLDQFLETFPLGERRPLKLVTTPRFATRLSLAEIAELKQDPQVSEIRYDEQAKRLLGRTIHSTSIGALHTMGLRGIGGSIVIIDDGVESSHPFLGSGARIRSQFEACFRADAPYCANGNSEDIGAGAGEANDGAEHGTAVAGIAVGSNPVLGVAPESGVSPGADYIPINVFRSGDSGALASFSSIDRALEYVEDEVIFETFIRPNDIPHRKIIGQQRNT